MKQMLRLSGAALMTATILAGCSSNGGPGLSEAERSGKNGATPRQLKPHPGGTNGVSYKVLGKTYRVLNTSKGYRETGVASWYGDKFHGRPTSTGEKYDMYAFTAAHKSLPLPTYVRVTSLANDRSVIVKVNDRGPFVEGRIIDLSYAAAERLGIDKEGLGKVKVEAVEPYQYRTASLAQKAGVKAGEYAAGEPLSSAQPATTKSSSTKSAAGYELAEIVTISDTEEPPQTIKTAIEKPPVLQTSPVTAAAPEVQTMAPVSNLPAACERGTKTCLQIGVFSSKATADALARRAGSVTGKRIEVRPLQSNGAQLYRVLIGPMAASEFGNISQTIQNAGIHGKFVNY